MLTQSAVRSRLRLKQLTQPDPYLSHRPRGILARSLDQCVERVIEPEQGFVLLEPRLGLRVGGVKQAGHAPSIVGMKLLAPIDAAQQVRGRRDVVEEL